MTSINAALRQGGASLRLLEERYGPSRSALSRHLSHLDGGVSPPPDAPPDDAPPAGVPPPSVTRLRTCPICQLPDAVFEQLDASLGAQAPSQSLGQEFGVRLSDLTTHTLHRQSEALSRERYAREQARAQAEAAAAEAAPPASPAALPWDELMRLSLLVQQQSEFGASTPAVLFTLRNITKLLPRIIEAVAQACGHPCAAPAALLLPTFRPGDLPPHADWQMRGRDEASSL